VPDGTPTEIQGTLLDAVHGHPAAVVTDAAAPPPEPGTSCDGGATLYVQPLAWVSGTVRPAIERDPSRAGPAFAATEYCTWPAPLPADPAAMVIHDAAVAAVHGHPSAVATCMAPAAGAAPTLTLEGLIVAVQPLACVIGTVRPAIESDASRAGPVFAATAYCTCPLALPLEPDAMVIQGAVLVAPHPHP
jgi:hypothetical protein